MGQRTSVRFYQSGGEIAKASCCREGLVCFGLMDDRVIRSPLLPGGDLIAAAIDREVLALADRGGASGLIGRQWADTCAIRTESWVGQDRPMPDETGDSFRVERVVRLDANPAIASVASKRGLQNPDLLIVGSHRRQPVMQAADAKFSVETARTKQVSPAVVDALLGLGQLLTDQLGVFDEPPSLIDGIFISPDFPLTHAILRHRRGIVRATVRADQVVLIPTSAREMFLTLEGASVMRVLAGVDALPVSVDASLLAALYYFRLARAAVGCWLDATKPLLLFDDPLVVDEPAVLSDAEARAHRARSALDLIRRWSTDVEVIRAQRAAVDHVASLPVMSREMRELLTTMSVGSGREPPSLNQVRRRLGAWYRAELRERMGPLRPPVEEFPRVLQELGRVGASLTPALKTQAVQIVTELMEQRAQLPVSVANRSAFAQVAAEDAEGRVED
jgi:hypothetical protein